MLQGELAAARQLMGRLLKEADAEAARASSTVADQAEELQSLRHEVRCCNNAQGNM